MLWTLVFNPWEHIWVGTLDNSEKEARRCGFEFMQFNGVIYRLTPDGGCTRTGLFESDIVYEVV